MTGLDSRRVVVTGSSGFIGQHLALMLSQHGFEVLALDNQAPTASTGPFQFAHCDILHREKLTQTLADCRPDAVIHLAARTDMTGSSLADYAANTQGVANVVEAINRTPSVRRAICTSSQLVCRIGYTPRDSTDYRPSTIYGESKVATERIWRTKLDPNVTWTIVRPTTVWGPGMNSHYARFLKMLHDGRYYHVGRVGAKKSYGYVGNIAYQYMRLLLASDERINRRTFYLADYEALPLNKWTTALQEAIGGPPIRSIPRWVATLAAKLGDLASACGVDSPYNSFRLANVTTPMIFGTEALQQICGELPFTVSEAARLTAEWFSTVYLQSRPSAGTESSSHSPSSQPKSV